MKKVEIVIGANYGDEGKGLMTRHFALNAIQENKKSVIVLHNGSAQHGHTVDYDPHFRHVYHHFGSGSADGIPTFFSDTFWVHPMEFAREYKELKEVGIYPKVLCDENARVITPFDMLIDHITESWIALQHGEREFGSCGFGTWCAIESRGYDIAYSIKDFMTEDYFTLMENTFQQCLVVLESRGVDLDCMTGFKQYFEPNSAYKAAVLRHFKYDLDFFLSGAIITTFDKIYNNFDNIIFENGQGLGLDKDVDNDWHTTSKTGLTNPVNLLKDKEDFEAEVCYVTRSYLTRHGVGPLEEAVKKDEINKEMHDITNLPNEFQGSLRFGYLEDKEQAKRIEKDWSLVAKDNRFTQAMAITHCNEFEDLYKKAKYFSTNPYSVINRG